jgi:hypothetical protein
MAKATSSADSAPFPALILRSFAGPDLPPPGARPPVGARPPLGEHGARLTIGIRN